MKIAQRGGICSRNRRVIVRGTLTSDTSSYISFSVTHLDRKIPVTEPPVSGALCATSLCRRPANKLPAQLSPDLCDKRTAIFVQCACPGVQPPRSTTYLEDQRRMVLRVTIPSSGGIFSSSISLLFYRSRCPL